MGRGWSRTVVAASAVISVGTLGGVVGQVWASAYRGRAHHVALLPGPGVTPFVQGLYRMIDGDYLPGYHLPGVPAAEMKTLGEWELTFHGEDTNEAQNVALCVQELDGVVIPAGGIFSFNDTVGERTEDRGFRPGLMYVAGQVVTGLGGGVCIPSTALYNAALNADMEIVERYNHSGPVSYATPGLDAAVVFGMKDMRFRNTSAEPVMIHASVLGNKLFVGISGRPVPGRRVVVERTGFTPLPFTEAQTADATAPAGEPQVKQTGRAGWIATVVRTVYQGDKIVRRETVSRDTVAPRGRVTLINPLDDPESPEALAAAEAALAAEAADAPTDSVAVVSPSNDTKDAAVATSRDAPAVTPPAPPARKRGVVKPETGKAKPEAATAVEAPTEKSPVVAPAAPMEKSPAPRKEPATGEATESAMARSGL
jgi:hypothetical protein